MSSESSPANFAFTESKITVKPSERLFALDKMRESNQERFVETSVVQLATLKQLNHWHTTGERELSDVQLSELRDVEGKEIQAHLKPLLGTVGTELEVIGGGVSSDDLKKFHEIAKGLSDVIQMSNASLGTSTDRLNVEFIMPPSYSASTQAVFLQELGHVGVVPLDDEGKIHEAFWTSLHVSFVIPDDIERAILENAPKYRDEGLDEDDKSVRTKSEIRSVWYEDINHHTEILAELYSLAYGSPRLLAHEGKHISSIKEIKSVEGGMGGWQRFWEAKMSDEDHERFYPTRGKMYANDRIELRSLEYQDATAFYVINRFQLISSAFIAYLRNKYDVFLETESVEKQKELAGVWEEISQIDIEKDFGISLENDDQNVPAGLRGMVAMAQVIRTQPEAVKNIRTFLTTQAVKAAQIINKI